MLPPWDLTLVLQRLTDKPFEPMGIALMKYVTLKTVFLTALSSGRRRSEVHALLVDKVKFSSGYKAMTLAPSPRFLAKKTSKGGPRGYKDDFDTFLIPYTVFRYGR